MITIFKVIIITLSFIIAAYIFYFLIKNMKKNEESILEKAKTKELKKGGKLQSILNNPDSKLTKLLKKLIAIVFFVIFIFILKNILFALVIGIGVFVLIGKVLNKYNQKKIIQFEDQLIEAFSMIAYSVKAGQSLLQAIENMVKTTKPPISVEFSEVLREVRLGTSVSKALVKLTQRVNSKDLKMAVTSINLARETGGNIGEILMKVSGTIRDRKKLKGKVESMTAQGKMSGLVMGLMPFIMLVLLYFIEPKIFGLMFTTIIGNILLVFIIVMVFIGMQFINKIVNVKM